MNLVNTTEDVVEVGVPVAQAGGQTLGHVAELCDMKNATQMADALLANKQLLDDLFGA